MSAEFQLLCHVKHPDVLSNLLTQPIDWKTVLSLVDRHRVAPLLHQALKNQPLVPDEIRQALHQRVEKNTLRAMRNLAALQTLLSELNRLAIKTLVLKGVGLALQTYGNIGLRHAGDIDLLIDVKDLPHAEALLQQLGYQRIQPAFPLKTWQYEKIQQLWNQFEYYHPQGQRYVDLHWRLSYNQALCDFSFAELYEQHQIINIQPQAIPILAPLHNLLYLTAHGSQHVWGCLFWLWDINLLLQKNTFDWTHIITTAQRVGCLRPLLQGIVLAQHLLNSPLPTDIQVYLSKDSMITKLVNAGEQYLQLPIPLPLHHVLWQKLYYDVHLNPRWTYRRQLLRHAFLHPHDWQTMPLPKQLFLLYYLFGSVLWLKRQL
ncbi:nucleotidyltransferase domain-containing protein [Beggiatoa leptomitoformis]|uniref:nucleotidyltransferase domain-containing protein n=1 Tax=Beggiatoa leptomitoformis TaxID=288004 RepID=UPI000A748364|nr:nucleotidyltransferase family protein [Beggiatoa leptomitoformis]